MIVFDNADNCCFYFDLRFCFADHVICDFCCQQTDRLQYYSLHRRLVVAESSATFNVIYNTLRTSPNKSRHLVFVNIGHRINVAHDPKNSPYSCCLLGPTQPPKPPNPTFQPRLGRPTAVGPTPTYDLRHTYLSSSGFSNFHHQPLLLFLSSHHQASHLPAVDCFCSFCKLIDLRCFVLPVTRLASCRFLCLLD